MVIGSALGLAAAAPWLPADVRELATFERATIDTVLAAQFIVAALAAALLGTWGWLRPKRDAAWCHAMFGVLLAAIAPYYFLIRIRFLGLMNPALLPIMGLGLLLLIVPYFVPRGRGMLRRAEVVAGLLAILHMAWFVFLIAFLRDFFLFGSIGALGFGLAAAGSLERLKAATSRPAT